MKLWEGLGYDSRVRNMQEAAKTVEKEYNGKLPPRFACPFSLLKGIGSYTAGAIVSIAYGIPVPAVDGNVLRVISRITESREDIGKAAVKRKTEKLLEEIMPKDRPGDFNQALMELGAVICIPNGQAKCLVCPVSRQMSCLQKSYGGRNSCESPQKTESGRREDCFCNSGRCGYRDFKKDRIKGFLQVCMSFRTHWDIWNRRKRFLM